VGVYEIYKVLYIDSRIKITKFKLSGTENFGIYFNVTEVISRVYETLYVISFKGEMY